MDPLGASLHRKSFQHICVFTVWNHSLLTLCLLNRQLYNLCQMFPESASSSMKFVLRDAMHEMEETIETRGRAAFPGLDVVSRGKVHQVSHCL